MMAFQIWKMNTSKRLYKILTPNKRCIERARLSHTFQKNERKEDMGNKEGFLGGFITKLITRGYKGEG